MAMVLMRFMPTRWRVFGRYFPSWLRVHRVFCRSDCLFILDFHPVYPPMFAGEAIRSYGALVESIQKLLDVYYHSSNNWINCSMSKYTPFPKKKFLFCQSARYVSPHYGNPRIDLSQKI